MGRPAGAVEADSDHDETVRANPAIVRFSQGSAAGPRLVCFPYAGAGALAYRSWAEGLPAEVAVLALRPPGRESRLFEPASTTVAALVDEAVAVLDDQLSAPFALFGHSLGALVAFEVARVLCQRGGPRPALVVVAGRRAPQLARLQSTLHAKAPHDEFVAALRELEGTPPEVLANEDLLRLLLPTLRADLAASQSYEYHAEAHPPLDCRLLALSGQSDPLAGSAAMEPWREQTSGSFELQTLPGKHFFLHSSEAVLLRLLSRELSALA